METNASSLHCTRRGRVRTVVASVLLVMGLATALPSDSRADEYCQARPQPLASVLLIHGGAWTMGSAAMERDLCKALARMGFRARSLEYPLGTVPGSMAYAEEAARQEADGSRPVYAAGYSAGGSVAEYLAVRSRVDGAVAIAPLSDFVDWTPPSPGFWDGLGMTPELRRRFSPIHNVESPAPMRVIHSPQDTVVPFEQSARMVAACRGRCELVALKLGLGHASVGARGPLLKWFAKRAAEATGAPEISAARVDPRRFAVRAALARAHRRRGAVVTYRLSEPAAVRLTIAHEPRRRGARRCPWQPERLGGRARCAGMRRIGVLEVSGSPGANRIHLSGMVRRKALRPGRYRVTLRAETRSGRRSIEHTLSFVVVERPGRRGRPLRQRRACARYAPARHRRPCPSGRDPARR